MHLTIYHNNHPIFLCNDVNDNHIEFYKNQPNTVIINNPSDKDFQYMLQAAEQKDFYAGIFIQNDLPTLQHAYWIFFTVMLAAGATVFNDQDELLLMYRRGFWDLPKGKVDDGETIEECALREVKEETGLKKLLLKEKITTTYHTYKDKSTYILKETHWFKMLAPELQPLIPQKAEQIELLKWVKPTELELYMNKTYASIKHTIQVIIE